MAAKYVNDIEIAKAQRDFELKNATFDQEVQTKKAQSELAYALQVWNWTLTFHYDCFMELYSIVASNLSIVGKLLPR